MFRGVLAATAACFACVPAWAVETITFDPGSYQHVIDTGMVRVWESGSFRLVSNPSGDIADGVLSSDLFYFQYTVGNKLIELTSFDVKGTGQLKLQVADVSAPVDTIPAVFFDLTGDWQTITVNSIPGFNFRFTSDAPVLGDNFHFGAISDMPPPPEEGVPEPATWAFMIAGFGMLGFRARARTAAKAAHA